MKCKVTVESDSSAIPATDLTAGDFAEYVDGSCRLEYLTPGDIVLRVGGTLVSMKDPGTTWTPIPEKFRVCRLEAGTVLKLVVVA